MKKYIQRYAIQKKTITVSAIIISFFVFMSFGSTDESTNRIDHRETINNDSLESVTAFMDVYKLLMSPRCMNCHPSGDVPLQGDDNHLHTMLPKRGKDGKGLYAMKCSNCHQPENTAGLHTPPGNSKWHLPPADMKMVFQGRTPRQLAKQLTNLKQNGNKNREKLIEHAH